MKLSDRPSGDPAPGQAAHGGQARLRARIRGLAIAVLAIWCVALLATRGEATWPGLLVPGDLPLWPFAILALLVLLDADRLRLSPGRGSRVLVALWIALLPIWHQIGYRVVGEGVSYYVFARSALFDGDLEFRDEYEAFNIDDVDPRLLIPTPSGVSRNVHAVGPAVLWAPAIAAIQLLPREPRSDPWPELPWPDAVPGRLEAALADEFGPGYDYRSQSAASLMTIGLMLLAAVLWQRELTRSLSPGAARVGVLLAVSGTPLLWYTFFEPTMSHATAAATLSFAMLGWRRWEREPTVASATVAGLLTGLTAMQRWQLIVWAAVPLGQMCWRCWRCRSTGGFRFLAQAGAFGVATTVALSPQFVAWKLGWGSWIVNPMGSGYVDWSSPAIPEVLFSQWHGLFTWHPLLLFATIGLAYGWKRDRSLTAVSLGALVLMIYVNASVADWWGRESFGARRFTALFPVFAWGFGAFAESLRDRSRRIRWAAALFAAVMVVGNFGLAYGYRWLWFHRDRPIGIAPAFRSTTAAVEDTTLGMLRRIWSTSPVAGRFAYQLVFREYMLVGGTLPDTIELGSAAAWRFLGTGWDGPESAPHGSFRWIAGHRAELWLPVFAAADYRLEFRAWSLDDLPDQVVGVLVNDTLIGRRRLETRPRWYQVDIPAKTVHAGLNRVELVLRRARRASDADPRVLGAAFVEFRLARATQAGPGS